MQKLILKCYESDLRSKNKQETCILNTVNAFIQKVKNNQIFIFKICFHAVSHKVHRVDSSLKNKFLHTLRKSRL